MTFIYLRSVSAIYSEMSSYYYLQESVFRGLWPRDLTILLPTYCDHFSGLAGLRPLTLQSDYLPTSAV